jgi:hypothetical protein
MASKELADFVKQFKKGDATDDKLTTRFLDFLDERILQFDAAAQPGTAEWKVLKDATVGIIGARWPLPLIDFVFQRIKKILSLAAREVSFPSSSAPASKPNVAIALEILAVLLDCRGQAFFRHHAIPLSASDASKEKQDLWRQSISAGERLDAWHDKMRAWVTVTVSEVNQHGSLKLVWGTYPAPAGGSGWYSKYDPTLAPHNSKVETQERSRALTEKWRDNLSLDEAVDVLEASPNGRWTSGKVVDLMFQPPQPGEASMSFSASALMDAWRAELDARANKKRMEALNATVFAGNAAADIDRIKLARDQLTQDLMDDYERLTNPAGVGVVKASGVPPDPNSKTPESPLASAASPPPAAATAVAAAPPAALPTPATPAFPPVPVGWEDLNMEQRRKTIRLFCTYPVTKLRISADNSGSNGYGGYSIGSGTTIEWLEVGTLRLARRGMHASGRVGYTHWRHSLLFFFKN